VYSLGVVLYELIAGMLPYEVRKKKMHEAARIICEEIPPPLRSRDRAVPRDVSLIVERCLDKNRRRRYQGAAALAADLKRHLAGERIPVFWRDVLRPYFNLVRQRGGALLIGMLVLALAAALAFATWLSAQEAGNPQQPAGANEIRQLVEESRVEATKRAGDAAGEIAGGIAELRRQVRDGAVKIRNQACSRHVSKAWTDFEIAAAGCERRVHAAWVLASQTYPAAEKDAVAKRHASWEVRLEADRENAAAEFHELEQACNDLVQEAQNQPEIDGLSAMKQVEQGIKDQLAVWVESAIDRITRLQAEAEADLWAYASASAAAKTDRK
jgi:hypothetical protein